jgi:hypothetical protein
MRRATWKTQIPGEQIPEDSAEQRGEQHMDTNGICDHHFIPNGVCDRDSKNEGTRKFCQRGHTQRSAWG